MLKVTRARLSMLMRALGVMRFEVMVVEDEQGERGEAHRVKERHAACDILTRMIHGSSVRKISTWGSGMSAQP